MGLIRGSASVPEASRDVGAADGPADPSALEARLTEQIRSLHSEIARLDEEAKQGRIHYSLLLQRGYSKDDDVCVSLVARQQEIKERIAELKDAVREAEALRQRLVATIKDLAESGRADGVDEALRSDVLRLIHRASLQDTTPTVIPDAAWGDPAAAEGMGRINDD